MHYVPVVAGTNSNEFVGKEESIGTGHSSKETGSSQDYILMLIWKDGSLFDSSLKNVNNDEPQPFSDAETKDDKGVNKESGIDDQERPKNSTQDVSTAGPSINTASINVNTGSLNINTDSPTVTTAPLKSTHADFFGDETEVDMSNITTTYLVPSTPNTRIHKDHPLDHVIGDVQSSVLTRKMTKTTNEQGFISVVYEGKTHEDLHTCLFACFLSQEEPKKVIQALKDPSWIKAIQEELLQFKLQQVWTLVDLPHGKRAIDYDEVFALVARIEAIRLFLAYASFKDFVVYQMDVKSAFLYGKIKEEVYVCQSLGFEDSEFPNRVYKVERALYGLHQAPRACDILLVQVYVDDIIFRSTKKKLCTEFEKLMHKKFQMSYMGELTFFLGLQVTLKVEAYTDSDYVGASLDRKSTTGGCQFLRSRLISCQCKKQTIVANSTTEAEYVAAASCCGETKKVLLSKSMQDYVLGNCQTARTLDIGEVELTTTIDGKVKIVTEASVRRHLQLASSDGISSFPNTKIFEQLSLMGENIPLFPTMIVQGLVVQGEGSTHPVESHHTPTSALSTSQPLISPTSKRTIRQEYVVPQPRSPTQTHVADEATSTSVDVRYRGSATTVTGLEAGQW
ncbi:putative reverse transcriptase, RNA-dependent DNA polymerase [Tanacetum coccineum]